MPHTGLAVVESRWWTTGNDSVRPLFETLAGIIEENPHSMRYDMFSDAGSMEKIIIDLCSNSVYHSVYIGAHGDENSITGLGNESISRTKLRNIFRSANVAGNVSGLYFGSCLVATRSNAQFFLCDGQTTGLKWLAGYSESVDWIDSSAIDMIFWSKYLHERQTNRSRRRNKKNDLAMVKDASTAMKALMPTVFTQLGFNIYYLDSGSTLTAIW
jgi:hypothetical protein